MNAAPVEVASDAAPQPPDSIWRTLVRYEANEVDIDRGVRSAIGVATPLVIGVLAGHPAAGMAAATGALNVSFLDRAGTLRERTIRTLSATGATTFAVLIGSMAGHHAAVAITTAAAGAVVAALATRSAQWVADLTLNALVVTIIFSARLQTFEEALVAAALAAGGGLFQALLAVTLGRPPPPGPAAPAGFANSGWPIVRRHTWRLVVVMVIAVSLARAIDWRRSYWLPMTVALVLKPDRRVTTTRSILRIVGTLFGLAVATLALHVLPTSPWTTVSLVGVFMFLVRCFGPANYGVLAAAIGAAVVLILSLAGEPPGELVVARALNTLAGGVLALVIDSAWPNVAAAGATTRADGHTE